jgi:hypothetical protein
MDKPIKLQNIWKKCSILLYVPQTLAQLSENSLLLYKNYLNYSGLAHDMNDLVNDIATHTISLPIHWFREVSPYGLMNVKVIEKIYEHATIAVEPIEYVFNKNNIESNFPLMHHLIKDLRIKKHI